MKWANFKSSVLKFMPVDSVRQNATGIIELQTKAAVQHLQRLIPAYRRYGTRYYKPQDGKQIGEAMEFPYPDLSECVMPESAFLVSTFEVDFTGYDQPYEVNDGCIRIRLSDYPWSQRYDLKCGAVQGYFVSFSDDTGTFWAYPAVIDGWRVELNYSAVDASFNDDDETGLGELEADAVADYVKAELRKEIERDMNDAALFMAEWRRKVRNLHALAVERRRQRIGTEKTVARIKDCSCT